MEDVAAMVAEAIARRAKAAQAARTAAAPAPQRAFGPDGVSTNYVFAPGAPAPSPGAKPPAPMGQQPAAIAAAAAARSAPQAPSPLDTALPDDGLPGLPVTIFGEVAAPKPQLLGAFSGNGLLAGIVLSEALARPISLREDGSGTLF